MKNIPFKKTTQRSGECVAFAVKNATGIDPDQFYRETRYTKAMRDLDAACEALKVSKKFRVTKVPSGLISSNNTIWRFAMAFPSGVFLVRVRAHAIAIVNGTLHDHSYRITRRITQAYLITKVK